MPEHLTDRTVAALPIPSERERQRDYWDARMRGFGVRVSYGGKRAFVVRYRVDSRLRRLTLGAYPDLSLADARQKAREALGDVAHGGDPAEDKQERRDTETFRGLTTAYLEMAEERHRSWKEEKRMLEKDVIPMLGHRKLTDIRRRDVRELVEGIARRRKAPIMANRTLSLLSRVFNYALDREWIEANPASRIPEPGVEQSRDRVLSDDELRELWGRLEAIVAQQDPEPDQARERVEDDRDDEHDKHAPPVQELAPKSTRGRRKGRPVVWKNRITAVTAQAFQVQLLTAQRPGEVRAMKWRDVDLERRWWSVPAAVAKNGRAHRVPLTQPVVEILEARATKAKDTAIYVFENHEGAGSIVHRGKKAASILCRSLKFEFRAHDLRRTAATCMAEVGVSRDHIAKVLNHIEGGPAATRVYDRYNYDAEKRDALERWARRLASILEGRPAQKVVSIRS